MTISQTICQTKPCMKRDGNERSSIEICHKIRSPLRANVLHFQFWISSEVLFAFCLFFFRVLIFSKLFFLTLFPTLFSTFSRLFLLTFCGRLLTVIWLLLWISQTLRIDIVLKTKYFSLLWDAKMASAFAVLLILTFALKTSTCAGVWLANYIPTLQEYTAGRDDLIKSYYHRGLEYTEILLFLVFSHGISLSLRQLKRILKAKGLEEETPGCSSCGRRPQSKRL